MRLTTVILLALVALIGAQEAVVEEAEAAVDTESDESLDLDEMLLEEETDAVPIDEPETIEDAEEESTTAAAAAAASSEEELEEVEEEEAAMPEQSGPFIDLLGSHLYSLEMIDETQAQLTPQLTNEALKGKKVVGLYFSADWCGPCRTFTPELVAFYEKMNARRGHKDDFEIVWISRCRDMQSFGQYFTHMTWLALPPDEAQGQRGQYLSDKYKVKGIPSLVLLDDLGNVITTDARNKIPTDKAGIGFPWGNPLVKFYTTLVPKSLRMMVKVQIGAMKGQLVKRLKGLVGKSTAQAS